MSSCLPTKICGDRFTIVTSNPLFCASDSTHKHAIRVYKLTGKPIGHVAAEGHTGVLEDFMSRENRNNSHATEIIPISQQELVHQSKLELGSVWHQCQLVLSLTEADQAVITHT
mgnify:CR=1 FL=1